MLTGVTAGDDYYRENYADYERQTSQRKLDFYLGILRRHVPVGARLHELGVGMGHFLAQASRDYVCSGSEIRAEGLREAQRRAPGARLWEGSCERIPEDPRPAAVVAWDVLEHIPDLDGALDCIRARLAPGGCLVAVVPVYDGPLGWLVRRLDRDPTHLWKWSRDAWVDRLAQHGFELIESGGIVRRLVWKRWYLHVTRPAAILRRVGSAFWFVARPTRPAGA
jgi:SAM-dependent methyltransferase